MCIVLHHQTSQSYGAPPVIWDHTVLPATRYGWTCPALTPAGQAVTRFTYPRGIEGWVYLCGWLYGLPVCRQLRFILTQLGIKLVATWSSKALPLCHQASSLSFSVIIVTISAWCIFVMSENISLLQVLLSNWTAHKHDCMMFWWYVSMIPMPLC